MLDDTWTTRGVGGTRLDYPGVSWTTLETTLKLVGPPSDHPGVSWTPWTNPGVSWTPLDHS